MTTAEDPISPVQYWDALGRPMVHMGLSKREHFALKAMLSIIDNPHERGTMEQIAEGSVKMADALIEALNK